MSTKKGAGSDVRRAVVKAVAGRVLVAKAGLDGHDRGAKVVALALREAGFEVIYTGRHVSLATLASTAIDEDVNLIGLSVLSGAHVALVRGLLAELKERGVTDIPIVVGGTISTAAARDELVALGVADVFPGGTALADVVERVVKIVNERSSRVDS